MGAVCAHDFKTQTTQKHKHKKTSKENIFLNALLCLLIASVPVLSKTATQVASALHPSSTTWCIDDAVLPLMTSTYSVMFILAALFSLLVNVPSFVSLGSMIGLILSAALTAMFTDTVSEKEVR